MNRYLFVSCFFCVITVTAQQNASVSFEKWLSLKAVGAAIISPNGKFVAYTVMTTDWVNNVYVTEIWLYRDGLPTFQLTRTEKGGSRSPKFTPDSKWISFLADRGSKTQLYLISVNGGEAFPITKEDNGVLDYQWSPDGEYIAFSEPEADTKKEKSSKERYGAFAIEGEEYKLNHLWLLHFSYDSVMADQLPCYESKPDTLAKKKPVNC